MTFMKREVLKSIQNLCCMRLLTILLSHPPVIHSKGAKSQRNRMKLKFECIKPKSY